ncbi:MAG: Coenzyme F420 hydrogenase/dehydrogenase, beta subunit C-terminal domain [Methermicoccaceae archaeon]
MNFSDLKAQIIDPGYCQRCGLCASFCRHIELVEGVPTMVGKCVEETGAISCGLCYDNCPQTMVVRGEGIGPVLDVVAARSTDPAVLEVAQDGGAVSEMLRCLFATGQIQAAVITEHTKELRTKASIITSAEQVLKGAGAKYSSSHSLALVSSLVKDGIENIAVVGTPCHIRGIANVRNRLFGDKFEPLKIGLFCMENFDYDKLNEMLTSRGITDVKKMAIREGNLFITREDGTVEGIDIKELDEAVLPGCKHCIDFTAEHSDISAGSVGSEQGYTTIILRTERGREFFEHCVEAGRLETAKADVATVKKLAAFKRKKNEPLPTPIPPRTKVMQLIEAGDGITIPELAASTGLSESEVWLHVMRLRQLKKVEPAGMRGQYDTWKAVRAVEA